MSADAICIAGILGFAILFFGISWGYCVFCERREELAERRRQREHWQRRQIRLSNHLEREARR